jgi:hypothetical protein
MAIKIHVDEAQIYVLFAKAAVPLFPSLPSEYLDLGQDMIMRSVIPMLLCHDKHDAARHEQEQEHDHDHDIPSRSMLSHESLDLAPSIHSLPK